MVEDARLKPFFSIEEVLRAFLIFSILKSQPFAAHTIKFYHNGF